MRTERRNNTKAHGQTYQRVVLRLEGGVIREGLLVELHHGRLVGGTTALLEVVEWSVTVAVLLPQTCG